MGHPAMRRIRARRRVILDGRPRHVPLQERDRAPQPMRELDELMDEEALAGSRQAGDEDHASPLGEAGERRMQIGGGIQEQHGGGRASYSGTPGRSRQRMPPEMWSVSPVINAASSEARNTAAGAISCGWPMRPSGVWASTCLRRSLSSRPAVLKPSVSTMPGLMALTRIRR